MLAPDDLNPTDEAILDVLAAHPATPAKIATETEYSGGNIRNRLSFLQSHDHVASIGGGMYQLKFDPRAEASSPDTPASREQATHDDTTADTPDATVQEMQTILAEVRRHVEAAEAAAKRGDQGELESRLSQASTALNQA